MTLAPTLRDRLRDETAPDHAAAACAIEATGCLDQRDPRAFMAIQARLLAACHPAPQTDDPETALALRLHGRLRDALRRDLGAAGAGLTWVGGPDAPARLLMPTGFAYVVLGATAGIALVAPRWSGRSRFFDLMADLGGDWSALTQRLSGMSATGARAEQTVAAARAIFAAMIAATGTVEVPGGAGTHA